MIILVVEFSTILLDGFSKRPTRVQMKVDFTRIVNSLERFALLRNRKSYTHGQHAQDM